MKGAHDVLLMSRLITSQDGGKVVVVKPNEVPAQKTDGVGDSGAEANPNLVRKYRNVDNSV